MKVTMLKLSAGPHGILKIGDVIEVSESEAKLLVDTQAAEFIEPHKIKHKHEKPKPQTISEKGKT